jgi:HK97 family phage portal protein
LNWFRKLFRLDTKATLSAPDLALIDIFTGGTVDGLKVPAVACAVRVISEAVATLPLTINAIGADGTRTPDTSHPAYPLLTGDWNAWTSVFDGLLAVTVDALTHDQGGFAFVNRVNGRPVEIIRYRPGTWFVTYDVATDEPTYRIGTEQVDPNDVIHIRSFGATHRCPVSLAREAICLALAMEGHATRLFTNGGRPSGVLSLKGQVNSDTVGKIRDAWNLAHGNGKSGGTAIVGSEATYSQLTLNSVDAQFLELRQFQIGEICRAFRIPPQMLFELGRATWANSEQMALEFLSYTLQPWLDNWESAFRRALLSPEERSSYDICFDTDDLTRADLSARAVAYNSLIASRVLNPNEARAWEGLPPYDGGDQFVNPNITVPAPNPVP